MTTLNRYRYQGIVIGEPAIGDIPQAPPRNPVCSRANTLLGDPHEGYHGEHHRPETGIEPRRNTGIWSLRCPDTRPEGLPESHHGIGQRVEHVDVEDPTREAGLRRGCPPTLPRVEHRGDPEEDHQADVDDELDVPR